MSFRFRKVTNMNFLVIILIVVVDLCVVANAELESPCPNMFWYEKINDDLKGVIVVDSPRTSVLRLDVRLSVGNAVGDYNGNIVLYNSKQSSAMAFHNRRPIKYLLNFPSWSKVAPVVSRISVNGDVVCSGPGINLQTVPVLTTIDLDHTLSLRVNNPPPKSDDFNPLSGEGNKGSDRFAGNPFIQSALANKEKPGNIAERFQTNPFLNPSTSVSTLKPLITFIQDNNNKDNHADFDNDHFSGNPFFHNIDTTTQTLPPLVFKPRPTIGAQHRPLTNNAIGSDVANVCGRDGSQGERVTQLVANGQQSDEVDKYPWLVAIYHAEKSGLNFTCGGSLVSHKHVLTAAHCLTSLNVADYVFQMGVSKLTNWQNSILYEASEIKLHPDYLPKSSDADLAVAILRRSVDFNTKVLPICWWPTASTQIDITGLMGRVAGWGLDENNQLSTANPKIVDLPVVDTADCLRSHLEFRINNRVTENSICAGTRNGAGPCRGDSGSGLMIYYQGRWRLRGVVSITILDETEQCKRLRNYAVFTDITKFNNWLHSIISS